MTRRGWLTERFEGNHGPRREIAYRTLGSRAEADDAVHEPLGARVVAALPLALGSIDSFDGRLVHDPAMTSYRKNSRLAASLRAREPPECPSFAQNACRSSVVTSAGQQRMVDHGSSGEMGENRAVGPKRLRVAISAVLSADEALDEPENRRIGKMWRAG